MSKPIFYDPERKRWKRLRRVFEVVAVVSTVVLIAFGINVIHREHLPELLLPVQKRNYHALKDNNRGKTPIHARRKKHGRPTEIPLNSGVGLRAAYYVDYDPASYSSLKQHIHQIDLLFPDWIHIISADGTPTAFTMDNRPYAVVDDNGVHNVDQEGKVMRTITEAKEDTDILPMVNNFNPLTGEFSSKVAEQFLINSRARSSFVVLMMAFLSANPRYRGLSMDIEAIPTDAQPGYRQLIADLYAQMHPKNLRLYINVPVDDDDWDLKFFSAHADGLILMNYDQHEPGSGPGPIASQDWFVRNLQVALKLVPKNKLICAIGNYGYDWSMSQPKRGHQHVAAKVLDVEDLEVQDAWQAASDSEATPELDTDSLNMHFAYDDDDAHVRHQIWYLDAVTAVNEMRAARELGIETFALWKLGSEDRSIWKMWDKPMDTGCAEIAGDHPTG